MVPVYWVANHISLDISEGSIVSMTRKSFARLAVKKKFFNSFNFFQLFGQQWEIIPDLPIRFLLKSDSPIVHRIRCVEVGAGPKRSLKKMYRQ